jgi:hypothetical protein
LVGLSLCNTAEHKRKLHTSQHGGKHNSLQAYDTQCIQLFSDKPKASAQLFKKIHLHWQELFEVLRLRLIRSLFFTN